MCDNSAMAHGLNMCLTPCAYSNSIHVVLRVYKWIEICINRNIVCITDALNLTIIFLLVNE
jgi:hypothetical protein